MNPVNIENLYEASNVDKSSDRTYEISHHSYKHYCTDGCWLINHCFKTFVLEMQKIDPTLISMSECPCMECILRMKCSKQCDKFDDHVDQTCRLLDTYKQNNEQDNRLPDLLLFGDNMVACYTRRTKKTVTRSNNLSDFPNTLFGINKTNFIKKEVNPYNKPKTVVCLGNKKDAM